MDNGAQQIFTLLLSCLLLQIIHCEHTNASHAIQKKIIDTLQKQNLTQFLDLLKKADLLETISTHTISLFAPLNSAFNALTQEQKKLLTHHPKKIGTLHIVEKPLDKHTLSNLGSTHQTIPTMNSNFILLFVHEGPATLLVWPVKKQGKTPEHMATIQGSITIDNGTIHVIDTVFMPSIIPHK